MRALLDFTNPKDFNAEEATFQRRTGIGCFDDRAALPPVVSRDLYDALTNSIENLRKIAFEFSSKKSLGIPFMLQPKGLLSGWMDRVVIFGTDEKLYKSATSDESTAFDEAAALFILHRLGCSNRESCNLFLNLSFVDLKERYKDVQETVRERELETFFGNFLF
jgi:hypothetical protein